MKTAILIYHRFCYFEIIVILEILSINNRDITIFYKDKKIVESEEGVKILADEHISQVNINDYDTLILPGAEDIGNIVNDNEVLNFIRLFRDKIIGAISILPILLLKAGLLENKKFMAGVNKRELYDEGFTENELKNMIDWETNIKNPIKEGYIESGNIITSVSYEFVRFGLAIANKLEIKVNPKSSGI